MNKLSDFLMGTRVTYTHNDGRTDLGRVVGWYCENIRVQWDNADVGDTMDYHYSNPKIALVNSASVTKDSESTEEKIKSLIVHLIAINETDRACEVIEVLKRYLK
jgi:hypothetical protein